MRPGITRRGLGARQRVTGGPARRTLTLVWLWLRYPPERSSGRLRVGDLSDRQLRDIGLRRLDDEYWPL